MMDHPVSMAGSPSLWWMLLITSYPSDLVPIGQLHVRDAGGVNDDDGDKLQDDEHFGGGGFTGSTEEAEEDAPPPYTEEELAEMGDVKYPEPIVQAMNASKLQCPVVIPQRRPGSKTRGFIRAYAPVLLDYGIDQETFLTFLKAFHKASIVRHTFLIFCSDLSGGHDWSTKSTQRLTQHCEIGFTHLECDYAWRWSALSLEWSSSRAARPTSVSPCLVPYLSRSSPDRHDTLVQTPSSMKPTIFCSSPGASTVSSCRSAQKPSLLVM